MFINYGLELDHLFLVLVSFANRYGQEKVGINMIRPPYIPEAVS
jgi:hypothetical protein